MIQVRMVATMVTIITITITITITIIITIIKNKTITKILVINFSELVDQFT